MLKNLKSVVSAAVVVAVLSVSATVFAASSRTFTDECYYPGVDKCGNIDYCIGNCLCTKICVNKKSCKVTVTAKGVVTNCSCKKQCYRNEIYPGCWWAQYICFKSSVYKVDKKGCANYTGCGKLSCCYADYETAMAAGDPS